MTGQIDVSGLVDATHLNGLDQDQVGAVVHRFRADPVTAQVTFDAAVEWAGGYRTRAQAGPHGPLAGDEPVDLAGAGTAPAPEELLLAAVGQCLVVGIVGAASARGLAIARLTVHAQGQVDLNVAYGLTDGLPGFSSVLVSVDLRADAPREELDRLVQAALARAPIPNTLSHPVPVVAELV
jgi:uncharacterized OsmC-like protein